MKYPPLHATISPSICENNVCYNGGGNCLNCGINTHTHTLTCIPTSSNDTGTTSCCQYSMHDVYVHAWLHPTWPQHLALPAWPSTATGLYQHGQPPPPGFTSMASHHHRALPAWPPTATRLYQHGQPPPPGFTSMASHRHWALPAWPTTATGLYQHGHPPPQYPPPTAVSRSTNCTAMYVWSHKNLLYMLPYCDNINDTPIPSTLDNQHPQAQLDLHAAKSQPDKPSTFNTSFYTCTHLQMHFICDIPYTHACKHTHITAPRPNWPQFQKKIISETSDGLASDVLLNFNFTTLKPCLCICVWWWEERQGEGINQTLSNEHHKHITQY